MSEKPQMVNKRNFEGRIVIESKSNRPIDQQQFFVDIENAILEGYRVAKNTLTVDQSLRTMYGFMGHVVMYKDGVEFLEQDEEDALRQEKEEEKPSETKDEVEPSEEVIVEQESSEEKETEETQEEQDEEVPELSLEDEIKALKTKDDCKSFAEKHSLEIPEDKKTVPVIKKFFKDSLLK